MASLGLKKRTHEEIFVARKAAMLSKIGKLEDAQRELQQKYSEMRVELGAMDIKIRAAQSKVLSFRKYCA